MFFLVRLWTKPELLGYKSANLWLFEIQKIWDFHYFWANLATFFFQNAILSKSGPRTIKNVFSQIV
jgi:hypothetical protein